MTTAQLIAELQKHPGDTPVFCCDEIGGSVRVSEFYFDTEPAGFHSDVPCIDDVTFYTYQRWLKVKHMDSVQRVV